MSPHDGDGDGGDDDEPLFAGVRFALVGFDPVTETQYRSDMVRHGGADAGGYRAEGCTHVVVCGLVYDDPVCVAARGDGKKVVTELWVDDTLETGAMADADRVLYWPVRDLNGIPGSQSLNICLTGYQKDGREDIMKMANLMGAQFSKPLRGDTVTHLICYKFEGEKYEVAKKVDINLVNHQWLEACLKAWEILPIDNYRKSGWEHEMMEAQVEDSEDEAEDAGRGLSRSRGIARSAPEIRMGTHVDPDVYTPIRDPSVSLGNAEVTAGRHLGTPKQVSKADVCKRSLDAIADIQSTHNTNGVINSADPEEHNSVHPPINPSGNKKAPEDHITRDKVTNGDKWPVDTRASALPMLNTNGATECADHLVHQPTVILPIPVVDRDNIDDKYLDSSDQFIANSVQLPTPSAESLLEKPLQSPDMSAKVDHMDNGPVANLLAKAGQSNAEGNLTLFKANLVSSGNSAPKNSPILGYSRRRSRKSVSPGTNLSSVHQTASPQSSERNTPNVQFSISPSTKSNHTISKLADAKSPRDEAIKCVDRSDIVLAQTDSGLSSASPLPLNGGTGSATETANSFLPSREVASEAATVSDLARNSNGYQPTKVNGNINCDVTVNHMVMQMSGSSKKKLLSYRRTSLKLAKSPEVEKLPEFFAKEATKESLAKAKEQAQNEVTAEKACAISPSMDSEFEKASSSFSCQNRNIETSNAPQVNSIEVPATGSLQDKEVSHATIEVGARKVSTSKVKNTSAKRFRNATDGAHTSFARRKSEIATSKSKHDIDAAISHENVEAEKDCTGPNAAECTASFPEEILSSRARNIATSSLNANREMNGVSGASKKKFANVILQGNTNKNRRRLPSSASDNDCQRGSSEKVSNAIARSAVANVPQPAGMNMAMAAAATTEAETVSLNSSFSKAVPQSDTGKLSSSASADNHATCSPERLPNNRVRKAVAKRKVSGAQNCISSEVEVQTVKWAAESSTNAGKAMEDKDLRRANEDGMTTEAGSFCKDSDTQNIRPRSGKKKKTVDAMDDSIDQNKENIPVNANLTTKSKHGDKCVSSKCIEKSVQNGKDVLCDQSMREGNDCGTLALLEPTWFILGGHGLLRKEYMSILRRLKGRVCRSSHHWSFQATHFIAPELRRTEKFFAAAAAGRWILKPDYLSACNEAGKFLEEEPFEWHGDGLNNGDTISLDAPRKWRHLRQRTGHGAFHGMKIIIYGECISPSLDTLKRALRAGDGTIVATSPPYTRLLKHDVSFAVVSAGVPSTDEWVQEFMNRSIPCVSADYLVEYVCKPGHPLSKHVLFSMHDLADKSLQKLQNSQRDELGAGAGTGGAAEGGDSEPSCSACGSSNREGALMLICSGSQGNRGGCGAGMHVGCLKPSPAAAAAAPDGDWLCPRCDDGQVKPRKKAKKGGRNGKAVRT